MKLFEVYNGLSPLLLAEPMVVEAKDGRNAVKKFLSSAMIPYISFKMSSGNNVHIKTTPIVIKNGQKYLNGRPTWWEILR